MTDDETRASAEGRGYTLDDVVGASDVSNSGPSGQLAYVAALNGGTPGPAGAYLNSLFPVAAQTPTGCSD